MFSKSNVLATLAGFVANFFLGFLIYGILTHDFFASHLITDGVMKAEGSEGMLFIAIGALIQSFIMATLYSKWARGVHSAKEGFEFGALIGIFVGFGIGILNYGVMNLLDLNGHLADGVISIIFYGLVGLVIALVYKATSKKEG